MISLMTIDEREEFIADVIMTSGMTYERATILAQLIHAKVVAPIMDDYELNSDGFDNSDQMSHLLQQSYDEGFADGSASSEDGYPPMTSIEAVEYPLYDYSDPDEEDLILK